MKRYCLRLVNYIIIKLLINIHEGYLSGPLELDVKIYQRQIVVSFQNTYVLVLRHKERRKY